MFDALQQAQQELLFKRLSPFLPALPTKLRLQVICDADPVLQERWRGHQSEKMKWVGESYRSEAENQAARMDSASGRALVAAAEMRANLLPTPERLDSLYVSATGMGGPNDAQATTEVNAQNPLMTPWTLQTLYQQDGLCTRICNIPPSIAILQSGWYVQDPTQDPDPMREEDERLQLRRNVYDADLFARIYGGGYLLIIAEEIIPPKSMREPLRLDNIKRIISLIPMTTLECTAVEPTTNPKDPNFGEPDAWACVPYPYLEGTAGVVYHHTRVLRFPAITLPNRDRARNRGADQSVLQGAIDALIGHGILNQSVGNIAQRMHTPVLQMRDIAEMLSSDAGEEAQARAAVLAMVRGVYGFNILESGEDLKIVSAPPTGWDQLTAAAMTTVCSKVGVPRPILFEPEGGFSQGDAQREELQALARQHWSHAIEPPMRTLYRYLYAQQDGPVARRKRASSASLARSLNRDVWTRTAISRLIRDPVPLMPEGVKTDLWIAENPTASIPVDVLIPVFSVEPRPLHTEDRKEAAETKKINAETDEIYDRIKVLDPRSITKNRFGVRGYQDEIQPVPLPPTDDGLPSVPDLSLQGILADVIRGGNEADTMALLNEEFPFLAAQTPGMVAAALLLKRAPTSVAIEETASKVQLTPADVAAIVTVDEARASQGLGPLGTADGSLLLAQFTAKNAQATAITAQAAAGEVGPNAPPEVPPVATVATDATPSPLDPLLHLEIPTGDTRRGISPDGSSWSIQMPCDYGDIRGTTGLDGEPVDYLKADGPRETAFIVFQMLPAEEPEEGEEPSEPQIDEHKVILGCADEEAARALYVAVYGSTDLIGDVVALPESQLIPWLSARSDRRGYVVNDGINFSPPDGVRAELKKGLQWHKEGHSGKGLVPATVAWARRLAAGQPISPKKAKKMRAWFARHESDKSGEGYSPGEDGFPSPGRVAWALWGGDPAVGWSNKLVKQLEAADRA